MGKTTTSKMRGSKTCGYGSKKKHRGHGSQGGNGMAGSKKHMIFKIWKEHPGYFDHKKLKSRKVPEIVINIKDLEEFKKEKLNLKELGYTKLLGNGETDKKFEIVIDCWSKQAEEKITKAGGKISEPKEKKTPKVVEKPKTSGETKALVQKDGASFSKKTNEKK